MRRLILVLMAIAISLLLSSAAAADTIQEKHVKAVYPSQRPICLDADEYFTAITVAMLRADRWPGLIWETPYNMLAWLQDLPNVYFDYDCPYRENQRPTTGELAN